MHCIAKPYLALTPETAPETVPETVPWDFLCRFCDLNETFRGVIVTSALRVILEECKTHSGRGAPPRPLCVL